MRWMIVLASFYGLSGVLLGAFGAHALKATLSAEQLASYETGVRYQLIHAVLLLVISLWYHQAPSSLLAAAGYAIATGIALFSFSIYLLATRDITGLSVWKGLGPVTPLGGVFLISGWACLMAWAIRKA